MSHKVADVTLIWRKSASPVSEIEKQIVKLVADGVIETEVEFGPEVEEHHIVVHALSSILYTVSAVGKDGMVATSVSHTFQLGDLVGPLAPTDLDHIIVAIRDEEHPPDPPVE